MLDGDRRRRRRLCWPIRWGLRAGWGDDRRDPGRARTTRWPDVGRAPGPGGCCLTLREQGSWDTQAARALRGCYIKLLLTTSAQVVCTVGLLKQPISLL